MKDSINILVHSKQNKFKDKCRVQDTKLLQTIEKSLEDFLVLPQRLKCGGGSVAKHT